MQHLRKRQSDKDNNMAEMGIGREIETASNNTFVTAIDPCRMIVAKSNTDVTNRKEDDFSRSSRQPRTNTKSVKDRMYQQQHARYAIIRRILLTRADD